MSKRITKSTAENEGAAEINETRPQPTMRETLDEMRHRRRVNTARVRRGQAPLGPDWKPVK